MYGVHMVLYECFEHSIPTFNQLSLHLSRIPYYAQSKSSLDTRQYGPLNINHSNTVTNAFVSRGGPVSPRHGVGGAFKP
jgi:hypothetical protein